MPPSLRHLFHILDSRDRRRAALMLVLMFAVALGEVVGVASVMPFIGVLANPDWVSENRWLASAYRLGGFTSRNDFLLALGAAFFVLFVGSQALKAVGVWAQLRYSSNRSAEWSQRLFRAYLRQPYEWFLNRHSADLSKAMLVEVEQVINKALRPMLQVVVSALSAIMLLVLLVVVDPVLAVGVTVVVAGGFAAISNYFRTRLQWIGREQFEINRARQRVVQESFGGIKEVKLAALEPAAMVRFDGPTARRSKLLIEAGLIGQFPAMAMQALLFGGLLLVLLYLIGVHGSFQSALPTVALYALAGYRIMPSVQQVSGGINQLYEAEAPVEALRQDFEMVEQLVTIDTTASTVSPTRLPLREAITLTSVRYNYPNTERWALDGVSLRIPGNQSIGIVGPTGSGKTTLIDIILGLLAPREGEMSVDGTRIDATTCRAWQKSLGYVPQQIFLTDESVASNIAFGLPTAKIDRERVEHAARLANLHAFIVDELPNGYDTKVGERGVRLSGGQRQRIGIARALYHDPDVLVFDEATSALDNLTEQAVMDAIRTLGGLKTIIMVAHRMGTVQHCDTIFMLDKGKIVASGSYEELLVESDHFRRMALSV